MSSTSYLQTENRTITDYKRASSCPPTGPNRAWTSLVGGVVVVHHLRQDPLLVSVHGLHPRRHLVALLGHVVAAGRDGAAQRGRAVGGAREAGGQRSGRYNKRVSDVGWF